ncbi:MAG: hypothetical protein KKE50_04790 [Nanoarchaeota archaeon]|nr:hypothetical protein [Nanoarchaeota archaeon]
MVRALVVEDHDKWQKFHKNCLESILGKGSVDIANNYEDAISMLNQDYGVYIIDGQFLRCPDGDLQVLGIQLAKEIGKKEGSYDKIVMVSSSEDSLSRAQRLGITQVYNKFSLNADENEVGVFSRDLRAFLLDTEATLCAG